jgi:anti-sigma regulatory factor (Ser/Thr protein kinase)
MLSMKTFPRPTESNDQDKKSGHRGGLLLMLAVCSNHRWLSVVRGALERLTEAMGFPAVQCRPITRAVDEALTNIVRHSIGNRLASDAP